MNKVSKIISIALVLVLALSVMVMPASAADGTINVTYKLEKYNGVDTNDVQAEDIYALTMYIDSTNPITNFTMPIYYERDKFLPVDGTDMSILDWEYTVDHDAACDGVAYVIPAGSDLADATKYKKENALAADRTVVTRGGVSGLAGTAFSTVITALLDQNKDASTAWWVDADPEKYGVFVLQFSAANGYCNIQGYGEPTPFLTFLFKAQTDDIGGAFFGQHPDGEKAVFVTETVATKFYYDANSTVGYPDVTVEAYTYKAPSPVFAETSQIRYNGPVNGDYAPFDVRTRAYMTAEDFANICGTDAEAKTAISKVGFVYADSSVGMTLEDAAKVIGGTAVAGCVDVPVEHIQKTADKYIWTCLLEDAVYADAVDAVGYIVVDGETYYFDAVSATDFSELYDTWSSKIPA